MKKLFKIILIALILMLITGCCWTDHSETIKKIAEPMREKLVTFYKKNKRFPNNKERDKMLINSGCSKVKNEKCSYGWKNFNYTSNNRGYNYSISLNYDNTYCSISITDDGKLMPLFCDNPSCIYMHQ